MDHSFPLPVGSQVWTSKTFLRRGTLLRNTSGIKRHSSPFCLYFRHLTRRTNHSVRIFSFFKRVQRTGTVEQILWLSWTGKEDGKTDEDVEPYLTLNLISILEKTTIWISSFLYRFLYIKTWRFFFRIYVVHYVKFPLHFHIKHNLTISQNFVILSK